MAAAARDEYAGDWYLEEVFEGDTAKGDADRARNALLTRMTRHGDRIFAKTIPLDGGRFELWYYQLPREEP